MLFCKHIMSLGDGFTVGVKLLSPPRGFREVCWTRPPVYEIPFRENFCWTGQTAGGGSNLTPTVNGEFFNKFY